VDDHVFYHRDGAGPRAGRVVAHGVHGCTVEDERGGRDKVRWARVLGVKTKAVKAGKVVDRGQDGAIVEHEDGRRVFVAGELPGDEPTRLSDLAHLEQRAGMPRAKKLGDLEEFARAGSKERTMAKADHDCEGPALCGVCRARAEEDAEPLAKAIAQGVDTLASVSRRMRARPLSTTLVGNRIPVLLIPSGHRED
jgi:hypothetical protein